MVDEQLPRRRTTDTLKERDLDSLPNRALRLQRIESYRIAAVPNIRAWDYAREAKYCYISGFFSHSMICSSIAVEQSFIHELIASSEDWERTYWKIAASKMSFGRVLDQVKKKNVRS